GFILICSGPDIGRRLMTGGVAKPVVLLEFGERGADAPIGVAGSVRRAIDQRVDGGLFPGAEWATAGGYVNGNAIPRVALRERPGPVLRTFACVDDRDEIPGDPSLGFDRLVVELRGGRDEATSSGDEEVLMHGIDLDL